MSTKSDVSLDFSQLPKYQKRQFVADSFIVNNANELKELYQKLLDRQIFSVKDLERWLLDRSEIDSIVDQEGSLRYIRMTCQTDKEEYSKAYQNYIEDIIPAIKPINDQLNNKFLKENDKFPLDEKRYAVYIKDLKTEVLLFRQENIELQTQVDLLSQEYQKICGAMTVEFQGKEQTLPQMSKYLSETNRQLREDSWKATVLRRLKDKDKLDEIFESMLVLRHQMAVNAGYQNYRDYKFVALHRFDYTPEDCKKYHETVERLVVPVMKKILERRKLQMQLTKLRPWDLVVDPLGQPALKPFNDVGELVDKCRNIFNKVDPSLGEKFEQMIKFGLLDLASRKGKAPGGYQSALSEARKPFIFMNAVGVDDDVRTLLHEAGHAFHSMLSAHDPLVSYRHGPMEFNEVASMSMELLAGRFISKFYNTDEEQRSNISHLEDALSLLVWVATIDSFQHWIYENPKHSREQRLKQWIAVRKRFGADLIDWKDLEEEHRYLWHRQLHIFEVPFYYIEYGIAQLGALQVWLNAQKNWSKAIEQYKEGLSLGGSRPLPELFIKAGIRFDFSEPTIQPLVKEISQKIGLL